MKRILYTIILLAISWISAEAQQQYTIELPSQYVKSFTSPSPGSHLYPSGAGEEISITFAVNSSMGIDPALKNVIILLINSAGASGFLSLENLTFSSGYSSGTAVFSLGPNTTGSTRGLYFKAGTQEICYIQSNADTGVSPSYTTAFPGETVVLKLGSSIKGSTYILKKNGSRVDSKTGTGGAMEFPVTVAYTSGRDADEYEVTGDFISSGKCTVNYYTSVSEKYARVGKTSYRVDRLGGCVTVRARFGRNEMFNDMGTTISDLARGKVSWWPEGSVEITDYNYSEGWCDIRFGFSENGSSYGRTIPSVILFDQEGNAVDFIQEGKSTMLETSNWISARRFTEEEGRSWTTDITYHDGLGRPEQTIRRWAAGDGKDIVSMTGYDACGREALAWLPTSLGTDGLRKSPDAVASAASAEYGDTVPFSETVYEASALDRAAMSWMPGQNMRTEDAVSTVSYGCNSAGELLYGKVSGTGTLTLAGTVAEGSFMKTVQTDPDGRVEETFFDTDSNIVMIRKYSTDNTEDTYMFYDNMGMLRAVVTPEGSAFLTQGMVLEADDPILRKYGYAYRYDSKGRTVEKRMPGKETEYCVYDRAGNLTAYQDGRLREEGLWMISGFDRFHRQTWGGTVAYSGGRDGMQSLADSGGADGLKEMKEDESFSPLAEYVYDRMPAGISVPPYSSPDSDWSYPDYERTMGMKVYERLYMTGEENRGKFVERAFYFDREGRPYQTAERYPDGETVYYASRYDFAGNPVESISSFTSGTPSVSAWSKTLNSYDSRGRLVSSVESFGNASVSTAFAYDSRDLPVGRTVSFGGNSFTESTGYTVQGWTEEITSPFLTVNLGYGSPVVQGAEPRFSGDLSEMRWEDGTGTQAYAFSYDGTGRLEGAMHSGPDGSDLFSEKGMTYDSNGNILSLVRTADGTVSDNMSYTYEGDRLMSVSGASSGNGGQYAYDCDGNMTHDGMNGIDIEYNVLGLVEKVSKNGTTLVYYSYLSDGTKVSAVDSDGEGLEYRGSLIYRRSGDGSRQVESMAFSGGRFVAMQTGSGVEYEPVFHITDHLGSVRAIADASGNVIERNSYYPFGKRWEDGGLTDQDNRYRYNGKEEQAFAGVPYTDYGARMYDPAIGRWFNHDPLEEKYYGTSPYVFCANNPMKYIDPDGEDIWEIDSTGFVVNKIEDKTQDTFHMVNKTADGAWERTGESISFDYGTIIGSGENTNFTINNENNGADLFKFLSDNTTVEIGMVSTLDSKPVVFSDNKTGSINMLKIAQDMEAKGHTITMMLHSHPQNRVPSGYLNNLDNTGDKSVANKFIKSNNYLVEHYVYNPKYNTLTQHDKDRIIGVMEYYLIFPK